MSSVVFSRTKELEDKYLSELLEEREWFERENFPIFLPKDGDGLVAETDSNRVELEKDLIWLDNEWKIVETDYFSVIERFKHTSMESVYNCHISRFGPEGKYRCPDQLFVRFRTLNDKETIIETISHELLHLVFEDYFESNNLTYAQREGTVDALILQSSIHRLFPDYTAQSVGEIEETVLSSILR